MPSRRQFPILEALLGGGGGHTHDAMRAGYGVNNFTLGKFQNIASTFAPIKAGFQSPFDVSAAAAEQANLGLLASLMGMPVPGASGVHAGTGPFAPQAGGGVPAGFSTPAPA